MLRTDARNIIDAAMREASTIGWIINQAPGELSIAAVEVADTSARIVLEIGCQHGGWMFAMRAFCNPQMMYVAVDPAFSTGWPIYQGRLRDSGVDVREIRATSRAAVARVREALAGFPIDVLHIDGSHVALEALWDFDTYSPLVRPGGLVLMHDVCGSQGPADTLHRILCSYRASRIQEFMVVCDTWAQPEPQRMGIAILRMAI